MKVLNKTTMALSVLIALLCAACGDKLVSQSSEKVGRTEGSISCNAGPGYCMACGLSFDGKYDCMPRYKTSCPGSQQAVFDIYLVTSVHESGKQTSVERRDFIEAITPCT